MKKIVLCFMFLALIFVGCTKEETIEPKTTYTFTAIDGTVEDMVSLLTKDGYYNVHLDLLFSEYGDGHCLSFNSIDSAVDDKKYSFTAHEKAEYVTVRIELTGEHSIYGDFEFIRYMANVTYLKQGANTDIVFGSDTMVAKTEPK